MNTESVISNEIKDAFFAVISDTVFGSERSKAALSELTEDKLLSLYALAKKHDLAHLLADTVIKSAPSISPALAQKLQKQKMMAIYRSQRIVHEQKRILDALNTAKIPHIALKGAFLRTLYPDAWMRTSCDIDVLVPQDSLDNAVSTLTELLGYKTDGKPSFHDVHLYSESGVHLELHFSMLENSLALDKLLEKVWDHATPASENSFEYKMSREFFVFHIIAHASYHFTSGGCGVRTLIDLRILLQNLDFDELRVRSFCAECGIEKFYLSLCELSDARFSNAKHSPLSEKLENYILLGGTYGSKPNSVAVGSIKKGGKLKYAFSRIILPYASLSMLYPSLKKHKWLFPFFQVRRWFSILLSKRLRSAVNDLSCAATLSKEKSAEVSALLNELDLRLK